jgi:hypothetical protein
MFLSRKLLESYQIFAKTSTLKFSEAASSLVMARSKSRHCQRAARRQSLRLNLNGENGTHMDGHSVNPQIAVF